MYFWRTKSQYFYGYPGPVPYFCGDWSWNNFYGHSPPFHWIIQEGLLSVTSESMCTKYWLTACSSLPRKSVARWTDHPAITITVDLGRKAAKQTIFFMDVHNCIVKSEGFCLACLTYILLTSFSRLSFSSQLRRSLRHMYSPTKFFPRAVNISYPRGGWYYVLFSCCFIYLCL